MRVSPGWMFAMGLTGLCGGCDSSAPMGEPGSALVRQTIAEGRPLSLTEELRIGGSDEEAAFFLIRGLALDDAGNVYVLDAGNHRVAVFDASGRLVRELGRDGQGPGDLSAPVSMWLARDTLAIVDRGNRLHFFLTDGTHVSTRSYAGVATGDAVWTIGGVVDGPGGWLLSGSAFFQFGPDGIDATQPPVNRSRLFRVEAGGDLVPAGLYWEEDSEGRWEDGYWVQAPFAYGGRIGVDGLGRVHIAMTGDYVLDVYDASGAPIRSIENEVPRVPIEGEMLDRWRAARACGAGDSDCQTRVAMALAMPRAEHLPVVEEIRGFVDGYTAVRRSGTDPDPDDRIIAGEYDFFAPDGRYMGTLRAGVSPRWFDGEVLLVTEWDEMQVASVVRYRVEAPADGS